MSGCKAERADGTPCQAPEEMVDPATGYCPSHGPEAAERLSEAGRKGAEATNRRYRGEKLSEEELPPLDSPRAAEIWLENVGRAVATGRLSSAEGNAVKSAVREWLRAREAGEQADRIAALEEQLEAAREGRLEEVES